VVTGGRGAELHFLTPSRSGSFTIVGNKFTRPGFAALSDLKTQSGGQVDEESIRNLYQDDAARLWNAITDTECGASITSVPSSLRIWTPSSRYVASAARRRSSRAKIWRSIRRAGWNRVSGTVGRDVKTEGTSRVTGRIEPIGDSWPPQGHARQLREGANDQCSRLADDSLGTQDLARRRRDSHDAGSLALDASAKPIVRHGRSEISVIALKSVWVGAFYNMSQRLYGRRFTQNLHWIDWRRHAFTYKVQRIDRRSRRLPTNECAVDPRGLAPAYTFCALCPRPAPGYHDCALIGAARYVYLSGCADPARGVSGGNHVTIYT